MSARHTPVTDMTGKMKRRKQQIWRRRLKRFFIASMILGLCAAVIWLLGFSSVLASKRVKVVGNKTLAAADVITVGSVPMGRPLIRINTNEIAQRVAALPQVEDAQVKRSWPNTVTIVVTERTPVFVATMPQGMFLVDKEGVAYFAVLEKPEGVQTATFEKAPSVRLLHDVAAVTRSLTGELVEGVFSATSPDKIQLQLSDGRIIFFGSAEDIELKVQVTQTLLSQVKASVYDVSAPSRPVVR
ncbi:MAG: cell division protein FtsQ/DivIB [Propionibacteriaceae bacterium]